MRALHGCACIALWEILELSPENKPIPFIMRARDMHKQFCFRI